jgi:undecaprenyl-diphosphatase
MPSGRAIVVVVVAGVVLFVAFGVLAEVSWPWLRHVDSTAPALGHAASMGSGALRGVAKIVTDLGSPLAVDIVAIAAAAWWAWRRQWWFVGAMAVARLGELGVESLAKAVVGRPRPNLLPVLTSASNSSFPSGHSAGSAAVYGTLAVLVALRLKRRAGWLIAVAAVFVLLVAASRVVLGVHYPTDVLAGLAIGTAWMGAGLAVVSFAHRKSESTGT